jgi:single-stranded DNA-binding protein
MLTTTGTGRLGADVEVITAKSGADFMKLRVAFDQNRGGTQWADVLVFRDLMETASSFKKGMLVDVVGKPSFEAYTSKTGEARVSMTILADQVAVTPARVVAS